jgi:hypothetical protein
MLCAHWAQPLQCEVRSGLVHRDGQSKAVAPTASGTHVAETGISSVTSCSLPCFANHTPRSSAHRRYILGRPPCVTFSRQSRVEGKPFSRTWAGSNSRHRQQYSKLRINSDWSSFGGMGTVPSELRRRVQSKISSIQPTAFHGIFGRCAVATLESRFETFLYGPSA